MEKQLGIIDELESTEQDPDQLRNLFRLDHLAARMRRYNDNLLVLAGSTVRTRSQAPIATMMIEVTISGQLARLWRNGILLVRMI